jgi:hypothetical protein
VSQQRVPLHRIKVEGDPASFATRGEVPWKERLEAALGEVAFDPTGTVLSLDFVVSARPGYPMGADLDNLCEPVIAVVAGRLGWFGGRRFDIRGLWARKRVGTPTGCEVSVFPDWAQAPLGNVPVLLDATWTGELPRSGRDLVFAQWVGRELRALPSPGSRVAVRVEFAGRLNIADMSTGRLKNVIDGLWPILGGTPGAPDDSRVAILAATQGAELDGSLHVTVLSQGQTQPTGVM